MCAFLLNWLGWGAGSPCAATIDLPLPPEALELKACAPTPSFVLLIQRLRKVIKILVQ